MNSTYITTENMSKPLLNQRIKLLTCIISDRTDPATSSGMMSIFCSLGRSSVYGCMEGEEVSGDGTVEDADLVVHREQSLRALPWITTTRLASIIEIAEEDETLLSTGSTDGSI